MHHALVHGGPTPPPAIMPHWQEEMGEPAQPPAHTAAGGGVRAARAAGGGGASGPSGPAGGGKLLSLSMHGNQLSYATTGALRDLCATNRQENAVDGTTAAELEALAPVAPALHLVDHQLSQERAQNTIVQIQLSSIQRALAEVRTETADLLRASGESHTASGYEAAEAASLAEAVDAELSAGEAAYEAERSVLDAELRKVVARRWQLEQLIESKQPASPDTKRAAAKKRAAAAGNVSLLPGQEVPGAMDAELRRLEQDEGAKLQELGEQIRREQKAHATRLWCDEQLEDISRILAAAKAKAAAAKAKKR